MSEPQPMPAATLRRLMAAEDPAAVREQRLNEANSRGSMFGLALIRLGERRREK